MCCTGPNCTFCAWRKENPIELVWERLLDEEACSSATLFRVDLTSSQVLDPSSDLSTQQTSGFLANFNDDLYFAQLDAEFEQILPQVEETSNSQPKHVFCCSSLPSTSTTCTSPSVTVTSTSTTFKRVYASKCSVVLFASVIPRPYS